MKLPIDFPLYDSAGRRVYWVYLQPRDDKDPCKGFITAPEYIKNEGRWADPPHRPVFRDLGCNPFHLTDEVHEWFEEQGMPYTLEYRWHDDKLGWHVGLRDPKSAVMAKLAWGMS